MSYFWKKIGQLGASVFLIETSLLTAGAIAQLITPSPTSPASPQQLGPAKAAPTAVRPDRSKLVPRVVVGQPASTSTPGTPEPPQKKSLALPLAEREPYLSDLDAIFGSSDQALPVHLVFAESAELTDVQVAQGAALSQALALHAGQRPLLITYGAQLVGESFNVVIGAADQVHHFISDQEAKKITKGYVAIQRMQNKGGNNYVLLVTGRTPEDVDMTVLSLGFVRVQFPAAASATIRDVILPATPNFIRQDPLEADRTRSFSELIESGAAVKRLPTGGVSLELFFPGYFKTDSDAAVVLNLHYMQQARTFRSTGSIIIRLNGHEITASQTAAKASSGGGAESSLTFPLRTFQHGRNLLEVTMNGDAVSSGDNDSFRVFADSELVMPKLETGPQLPDLQLVSQTFYPFIGQPNGSDLAILMAERNEETINATWTLLSRLAQSANALLYAAQLTFDRYELRRHVLAVGTYDRLPPAFRTIVNLRAFDEAHVNVPLAELDSLSSGTNLKQLIERLLDQRTERVEALNEKVRMANLPQVSVSDRDFGALAMAPPTAAGRGWSLVVTGFTNENLLRRVRSLVQEPFWSKVRGDIDRWKDSPETFQARVPGEARDNARSAQVELPLGERIDFRIWVGVASGIIILFVIVTARLLGKFDEALVLRQRRPR